MSTFSHNIYKTKIGSPSRALVRLSANAPSLLPTFSSEALVALVAAAPKPIWHPELGGVHLASGATSTQQWAVLCLVRRRYASSAITNGLRVSSRRREGQIAHRSQHHRSNEEQSLSPLFCNIGIRERDLRRGSQKEALALQLDHGKAS